MYIVNTADYEVGASGVQFPPGVPVEVQDNAARALIAANPSLFAEAPRRSGHRPTEPEAPPQAPHQPEQPPQAPQQADAAPTKPHRRTRRALKPKA